MLILLCNSWIVFKSKLHFGFSKVMVYGTIQRYYCIARTIRSGGCRRQRNIWRTTNDVEKIYFDMDGVLADFERGVREICAFRYEKAGLWKKLWDSEIFAIKLNSCGT